MRRTGITGCFLLILLLSETCVLSKTPSLKLELIKRQFISEIPSASGVEWINDHFYIIGDNSSWLFKLNSQGTVVDKSRIHTADSSRADTIPKKSKPDFEAMTLVVYNGNKQLYIFGSGSKSPQRELLIKADPDQPQHCTTHNLTAFFRKLKENCKISDDQLNIEAAIATTDSICLFNRGTNALIWFSTAEFNDFITGKNETISFRSLAFDLPDIKGVKTGFSGAALLPDENKILFTATAENTANWIDDGEILGSIVGILDLKTQKTVAYAPLTENEELLPLKIESVAVKRVKNRTLELVLVSDQDGGTSELIYAKLKYSF